MTAVTTKQSPRERAWENYERVIRSSVTHQFARWTLDLTYDALPEAVVREVKRIMLDTFACAMGAYPAKGRVALENMARERGGEPESTVIGSGMRTSASNAMLINTFMIRQLDYNDHVGGGHNSDSISPILAVAEAQDSSTRDLITAIVVSYELGERIRESLTLPPDDRENWVADWRAGLTMPAALGKLMGLTEDQMANAMGISMPFAPVLGITDADRVELAMVRNLRFGIPAHVSLLACQMAKHGFTGFVDVVEGDKGVRDVLMQGHMDMERIVDFSGWRLLKTTGSVGFKIMCHNGSPGHVEATIGIVTENDLQPDDIESVTVTPSVRDARHVTFNPPKKYPRNEESASHGLFFATAVAIKDRMLGPLQLKPNKFDDPVVLDLIEKVHVDDERSNPTGTSVIRTRDGRLFKRTVSEVHGRASDPLSDREVEDKFRNAAGVYLSENQAERVIQTVWELESAKSVSELMQLLVVNGE